MNSKLPDVIPVSRPEKKMLVLLERGEQEIEEGRGHDLDEVLAEADEILARPS